MYKNSSGVQLKSYTKGIPDRGEETAKWIYLKEPLLCGVERQAFIQRIRDNMTRVGNISLQVGLHMKSK